MEAYLLLEAARSDRQISLMRKNLAHEIVHRNTITLQLNRISLERAEKDLHTADEFVGKVRLTIRQSGQSTAKEYAMREPWPTRSEAGRYFFYESNDFFILPTQEYRPQTSLMLPWISLVQYLL